MCGVRGQCVAFRADAWRCEGIGLLPTYRIPRIRTTQGTTRGLGGGRTIRKRHVTERRRRTIARERRAHRHVPSSRSILGPLLLYETAGPVKTHDRRTCKDSRQQAKRLYFQAVLDFGPGGMGQQTR